MASKANTAPGFIAQLLVPLPAEAEQVTDKRFLKALKEDLSITWNHYWDKHRLAAAEQNVAWCRFVAAGSRKGCPHYVEYGRRMDIARTAIEALMLCAAPGKGELKIKRDWLAGFTDDAAVVAAFHRDHARLSVSTPRTSRGA